ncbi:MAG: DUF1800 domain-containing protein [Planctomycetota bacterium]
MPLNTSLNPLSDRDFGIAQARHLLVRVGLGANPVEVRRVQRLGLTRAVRELVEYQRVEVGDLVEADTDPDIIQTLSAEEVRELTQARRSGDRAAIDQFTRRRVAAQAEDRRAHASLQAWWVGRMIDTPRPAEENLTLLWHGHFASRHRDVRDAYLMQQQNAMFRRYANGSFEDLARGIVRDPAMIKFLNNDRNNRRRPNENLSRELMELFTLGEGHYTEADIKEGARALTGYHVDDNDFAFRRFAHDSGDKTILGRTDDFDGDGFVQLLLRQQACSRFVALKLYRHLVADVSDDWDLVPSEHRDVIDRLARQLRGSGYELKPVLTTLLRSRHFYDRQVVGKKIKSPVQVVVGTARTLGTPTRDERGLVRALRAMGQDLFEPPSVAGWPGGRSWINTSTLFLRQNTNVYQITGSATNRAFNKDNMAYDPMHLLQGCSDPGDPGKVVDHLADALLGEHLSPTRREPLQRFMAERTKGVTADSVVGLLLLITAMPEYQLC